MRMQNVHHVVNVHDIKYPRATNNCVSDTSVLVTGGSDTADRGLVADDLPKNPKPLRLCFALYATMAPQDHWRLAQSLLDAGRRRLGPEGRAATTSAASADALADLVLEFGARQLQADTMRQHNALPAGSLGAAALVSTGRRPRERGSQSLR
jgi:hypothetical protein